MIAGILKCFGELKIPHQLQHHTQSSLLLWKLLPAPAPAPAPLLTLEGLGLSSGAATGEEI